MGRYHSLSPTISTQYGVNLRISNQLWNPPHSERVHSASSPPPNIESPNPNNTQLRSDVELDIQRIIYKYCYPKVQRRFRKRGPEILAKYDTIAESLYSSNTVIDADIKLLNTTRRLLENINDFLQDQIPEEPRFTGLIKSIAVLSVNWKKHLGAVEEDGLLTRWDNLTFKSGVVCPIYVIAHLLFLAVKKNRHLSLRRFLQKLITLYHHIRTILRIAWSKRLTPFLNGQINVVPVPGACGDISIKFSRPKVIHAAFVEVRVTENVKQGVCTVLLNRLLEKAKKEGIEMKMKKDVPELSLSRVNVHAESSLLAYHLQNPEIHPYRYFGGSKLSCHGCGIFFNSFNSVAASFGL
jgi:hypothetical protein